MTYTGIVAIWIRSARCSDSYRVMVQSWRATMRPMEPCSAH